MRKRRTLRVLMSESCPVAGIDLFDEKGWLIKYRKITTEGLLVINPGQAGPHTTIPGPVEVPAVPFYRQLIREGYIIACPDQE